MANIAAKLWKSKSGRAGIILCSIIVLAAIFAPLITLYDPLEMGVGPRLNGPSGKHLLGTDEYGRDILTRILYGARTSIVAGVGAVFIASFIGVNTGMIAGYFGGATDSLLMRIMDAIISFPATLMAIVVIAIIGTNSLSSILAIAIVNIPTFARLTRANVLSETSKGYVEANRALGFSHGRIMYQEILPNVLSTLFVQITVSIANAIMLESALSFLGLGNPPPAPSWGSMLSVGKDYMLYAPTYAIFPGLSLTILIVGLYLLGDGLRDVFDSRQSGGR